MVASNRDSVAKAVQDLLNQRRGEGVAARVVANEVRAGADNNSDWWWVPVEFTDQSNKLSAYYDVFAEIEENLEEQQHLNVLLVPRKVQLTKN